MSGAPAHAMKFEDRLSGLDTSLFRAISSQSSDGDRRSLLALQRAVRELRPGYGYLEIGSYLGGSIQPHLIDPACGHIVSIDKRPPSQSDNSGLKIRLENNSTERMMMNLGRVPGGDVSKVHTIEGESGALTSAEVPGPIHLCFVDGEHVDPVVERDFALCAAAVGDAGLIVFHDAQITYNALSGIVERLHAEGRPFHAYNLPDVLFVIELGDFPAHRSSVIAEMLLDNHVGYLASLRRNDHFRRWANLPPIRAVRAVKARLEGTDLSE